MVTFFVKKRTIWAPDLSMSEILATALLCTPAAAPAPSLQLSVFAALCFFGSKPPLVKFT